MLDCFGIYSAIRDESGCIVDFKVEYVNKAACVTNLMTRKEQVGKRLCELLPSHRKTGLFNEYCQIVETGKPLVKEALFYEDVYAGQRLIRAFDIRAVKLGDGFTSAWRDITESKQTEEALQESEQNFRNSLDSSPLGIRISIIGGGFLYANQALLDIFGYSSFEELKSISEEKYFTPQSYAERLERRRRRKLGKPAPDHFELDIVRKDGEVRHLMASRSEVLWGTKMRSQVIYQDVTKQRQMEEQLRHSHVLASLGEMTAGIAHEVNNPLSSALLYSEVLLKSDISRQTRKDLRIIHNETKRATKIMRDLLAYTRKLKPHMRRLNLHSLLRKVLGLRQYQQKVQNISVSTNLLDGTLYVKGDPSQFTQVLLNLMLNAEESLQEHKGGNIKITTEADGEWAKISIADDGTGIPEDKLSQVFHPFFTTKEIGEGSGLGLSICYGIITAHGGLIRAENNEMGGATFIVEIPLAGNGRQGILSLETEVVSS